MFRSPLDLLSREWVEGAVELILSRFLPLKVSDLEKWEGDSEEWINDEGRDSEAWEFDMRVRCASSLQANITFISHASVALRGAHYHDDDKPYAGICSPHPSTGARESQRYAHPRTRQAPTLCRSALDVQGPKDLQSILRIEALYCAVGRCLTRKETLFNLGQWLDGPFSANVSQTDPR